MKKSDIVISIFFLKSVKPPTERDIRKQLTSALNDRGISLKEWDKIVDPSIATQIITKVGATRGELSMEEVIRDVDLLFKRAS